MFNSAKQTALQALPPQHHVVTVKTGFKRGMLYGIMIGFFVGGLSAYQAANDSTRRDRQRELDKAFGIPSKDQRR
jgi:hypothetical protein